MTSAQIMSTSALMIFAYVLGAIPFSYLVAKTRGVDLRKVGSGNIGGANVWRSCGFGPFLIATSSDILKGTLPTLIAIYTVQLPPYAVVLVGISAILGHTFPVFLRFKGGKAVATSGGVLLAMFPLLVVCGIIAWAVGFWITRVSAVGSLTATAIVLILGTIFLFAGQLPMAYAGFIWIMCGVVTFLHRENIRRLMAGTERRFNKLS
ncbi:MAG: glycerol-3-phosphate 1-O-acyltransferase [Chloroflexi bacterium AL-W]|nr:glycerol-3-phosphate 1-O-acyltransferase [Chloroflexi bacterium AL-N1]NOK65715.1 glycerol-3-phosphate 1-O-acyltransferase [Chloroflexi bacterium AL-N10]NOK74344.1 glycerol-3-phosphate 1-O-acyltransferase [Chloroflexi bacterium AL-N5]NOK80748.1 glycerol-3-phosphate 1-O-acyltransferase [Chloroflexi bacterium AL-W]NOK88602.1 glycerol-3-phosphate 1-O-acyltransferase [Chloroflexi bacterium AL-N15]